MRAWWCGFALGVFWLQRQAALPDGGGWCVLVLLGCVAIVIAVWGLRRGSSGDGRSGPSGGLRWGASVIAGPRAAVANSRVRRVLFSARLRSGVGWGAVWIAALCVGFGYAAWRAETRLAVSLPSAWEGRDIDVVGSIKGLPSRNEKGARFLFEVESADAPIAAFPRVIQLSWIAEDAPAPLLEPGERWQLTVRLKRPHGNANFGVRDAEASLLARNVRATGYVSAPGHAVRLPGNARGVGVTVDRWRAALRARIGTVLADAPHRGIVVALAIGAQDEVSAADWLLMRGTGTSHLVAISGLHIGFVAGLAAWLAGAVWRRSGFIGRNWPLLLPAQIVAVAGGALFAGLHAALAGFNVPAQRALWMAGVVALAFISGRNVARSVVLAWALGLVLLIDPWAVVSAGFWLSFCAVAAILFAMSGRPRVQDHEQRRDEEGEGAVTPTRLSRLWSGLCRRVRAFGERLRSAAHVQFAVTVALAPLTVYWFAQIPLIGPLANAFAIPWVSLLVAPAVLAGVALPAPFDAYAFRAAHTLLDLLAAGLQMLSGPAWTLWRLPQPEAWTLAAAAVGVLWCLAPRGWPLRWAAPLTWLPLLMPAPPGPPHGSFRVTALDVGQGTSVLVETAHHVLLFDAGPGPESTHAGERVVVPFLQAHGVTTLDALLISHADSDHSGGAPAVLDAIEVRQMVAALAPTNPLWSNAKQRGADTLPCAAGQRWQWDGVEFAILWPDAGPLQGKPNAHCCVLRVSTVSAEARASAGNVKPTPLRITALLTADIEAPVERILLARDRDALRAQVLVVPHHGSKTSSTEPFLDSIDPLVALFQVGYRNRFHHPNTGVFERYKARHIELARSDADGAVRVDVSPDSKMDFGPGLNLSVAPEGSPGVSTGTAPDLNSAALTLERYRDTQRRYWMDR
ncbi:DNA internalization-related competence protein ComEC/Rec2 [Paraburkholderia sp. SEWSISQ10-3 4]|uniref:DNA internalization-related competence protein ComEC/Rec2 n=1 Tax=Paraburkholderia TaxID=1822464 RepID=UPI0022556CEC|nr:MULTISPECIES: DNA internalization-related competence protein ComEC/Rec2 [Paraburkholderia]MCX4137834.1 DNA internalization-related competence protein ComEC/Rec2 [Paraburkholderia aspalathi]MDN7170525.1 DNA internalization-related competence protein ComEC/Rec2 [Paraburkholderia sp. SEWSISQ10-3 4]MDQ6500164.1 DNA internalization-related competence protein ComEC/Rec2 [Paraburkholderia aspalathi]